MTSFQPSQAESQDVVVSAVQKTRLTDEQIAVAAAAAMVVCNGCRVTPSLAARAEWEREGWDIGGFPEPAPVHWLAIADVWGHANAAARSALAKRWPDLDTQWIGLELDDPPPAA